MERSRQPILDIRPALPTDALYLGPRLSAEDLRELEASSNLSPTVALLEGVVWSSEAWTARLDGEPVCMWGVRPADVMGWMAAPWMLGTDAVAENGIMLLRRCRGVVARWARTYPVLRNMVDARHTRSIRWLRWLGFEIGPAVPLGRGGLPFHVFTMRADNV